MFEQAGAGVHVPPGELPPELEATPIPIEDLPDVIPSSQMGDSLAENTLWEMSSEMFEVPEVLRK